MLQAAMPENSWVVWAAVSGGSAAGGLMRHLFTEAAARLLGTALPWGTLGVNVTGSVLIGVIAAVSATGTPLSWSPTARHAAMTGVLGGFTTFSSFSLQTVALAQHGHLAAAAANVAGSVVLCLFGCWAGFAIGSALTR
jgi:CrcB protein